MTTNLGFLESNNDALLESRFFPSKVGGKPAWLDLKFLPKCEELCCPSCNRPRCFLCQIYCPIDDIDDAFHRTIFMFVCLTESCFKLHSNKNFLVYRSQLKRDNLYYPYEPPEDNKSWRPDITCAKFDVLLCKICNIQIPKETFRTPYCLIHKDVNSDINGENVERTNMLAEFELRIEAEDEENESESDEEENERKKQEFERLVSSGSAGTLQNDPSVERIIENVRSEDKYFTCFKLRTQNKPEQVIRYDRETDPIWITENNIPTQNDIPRCEYCGANRKFEFQILPQLLNTLKFEIMDWGILCIYTCEKSCNKGPAYKREFLWKQDLA